MLITIYIRFIPQGTVDNNLRPDRLTGTNPLDCRQPTLWLHDIVWKSYDLHLFEAKTFPYSYYWCCAFDIQLITSLAMTQFGLWIEPMTSQTPSGCDNCYATDVYNSIDNSRLFLNRVILVVMKNHINHVQKYKSNRIERQKLIFAFLIAE